MESPGGKLESATRLDQEINTRWREMITNREPVEVVTKKGVEIKIKPKPAGTRRLNYHIFIKNMVIGHMYVDRIVNGWVRVVGAEVSDVHDRREGIASAVYDQIEKDIREAGGKGLEPHWGSMSKDAIAFWKNRRPDVDIEALNNARRPPGSGFEK